MKHRENFDTILNVSDGIMIRTPNNNTNTTTTTPTTANATVSEVNPNNLDISSPKNHICISIVIILSKWY